MVNPIAAVIVLLIVIAAVALAHQVGVAAGEKSCAGGSGKPATPCPPCPTYPCPLTTCFVEFSLDAAGNPCIKCKDAGSPAPAFGGCGIIKNKSAKYDPFMDAILQTSAEAIKQKFTPCSTIIYKWDNCGDDPGAYWSQVRAFADPTAFQKAVVDVCNN